MNNEWYTPSWVIEKARNVMGAITLDPASCDVAQQWIQAEQYYTINDDGLDKPWSGKVWINPPYSREITQWVDKLVSEWAVDNIEVALLLVNPCVGTAWYRKLAMRFPRCEFDRRIKFVDHNGHPSYSPRLGSVLFLTNYRYLSKFRQVFSDTGVISIPFC